MKQTFITLLLIIAATVANAQTPEEENFAKRLFEVKLAEISLKLNLTDEQKTKFAPIYEQYCNEMNALREKPGKGIRPMMGRPGAGPEGEGMRPHRPIMGNDGQKRRPGMRPDGQRPRPEDLEKPNADNKDKANKKDKDDKKNKVDKKDKTDKKDKAEKQRSERKPEISDAEKVKHMKERMEKQKKAQEIRLNYSDKFATVLTDKQLVEFYEVENDIQRKLRERVKKADKKD